jgi:hypothetical protein
MEEPVFNNPTPNLILINLTQYTLLQGCTHSHACNKSNCAPANCSLVLPMLTT